VLLAAQYWRVLLPVQVGALELVHATHVLPEQMGVLPGQVELTHLPLLQVRKVFDARHSTAVPVHSTHCPLTQ
jgi:ATP-dependent protease HslVU (ClpYQ) ATPase subunit